MTRTLRLPIFSIVSFLIILFSLSVFSCKASAKELINTNTILFTRNDGLQSELRVNPLTRLSDVYYGFYTNSSTSYSIVFFSTDNFTVQRRQGRPISPTESWSSYAPVYLPTYGGIYVYQSDFTVFQLGTSATSYNSDDFLSAYGSNIYNTKAELLNSELFVPEAFADFGLNNFKYITSFNNTLVGFYTLDYTCYWNGSTSSDYPLTNVNFEIYGFYHKDTPVTEFDNPLNAVLLNSGSNVSTGTTFDFRQWVNHNDISGTPYEKFVLYLIPFSDTTQGNTSYIEADLYKTFLTMNLGPFSINDDDSDGLLLGFDASFTDGVIPVNPTDAINNVGVNYIDGVPVVATVNNISGSFNKEFNINHITNNYNPVVYVTNDNSVNDYRDMSTNITNNNNYNFNFTGKINTDDDDGSINGIIAFLTALVTFFNTFWSYVIVCLNWLPTWCITFIITVFSSAASIIIALGIFKLLRGG